MTGPADCGEIRHSLGVYIVGAIDPAERAIVDAHLSHCQDCREELAGLASLPALLGRVPAAEVERMFLSDDVPEEPPAELLDLLLRRVSARRRARRSRIITAAAAAAVIAVGGGIAGGFLMPHEGHPASVASSSLVRGSNHGVDLTVYYDSAPSGMSMQVQVNGVRPGTTCVFWVITRAGAHVIAGTWSAGADSSWYHASSTYTASQLSGFDVSAGNHVLARAPIG